MSSEGNQLRIKSILRQKASYVNVKSVEKGSPGKSVLANQSRISTKSNESSVGKREQKEQKWSSHLHSILKFKPTLDTHGPLKSSLRKQVTLNGSFSSLNDKAVEADDTELPKLLRPESKIFRKDSQPSVSTKQNTLDKLLPGVVDLPDIHGSQWRTQDRREYELQQLAFICIRSRKILEAKKRIASKNRSRSRKSKLGKPQDYVVSGVPNRSHNISSSVELMSGTQGSVTQVGTPQNSVNERSVTRSKVLKPLRSARESFLDFKANPKPILLGRSQSSHPNEWNEKTEEQSADISEENRVIIKMYRKDAQDKQLKLMKRRLERLQLTKKPRVPPASIGRDQQAKEKELPLLQELKKPEDWVKSNDEGMTMPQRMHKHRQYLGSLRRLADEYRAQQSDVKPEVQLTMDLMMKKPKKQT